MNAPNVRCVLCGRHREAINRANAEAQEKYGVLCTGGWEVSSEKGTMVCDACVLTVNEVLRNRENTNG